MHNSFSLYEHAHKRLNPLTGEWVLVSPHRSKRPWLGKTEKNEPANLPDYDPTCYLCPGNKRSSDIINPQYAGPYVFQNDFPALLSDTPEGATNDSLLQAFSQKGICKVICFSENHNRPLPLMEISQIKIVVDVWQNEYKEISKIPWVKNIQIFENRGEIMGCSNPHPHGQIWALNDIPQEILKETKSQRDYFLKHSKSLLLEYVDVELEKNERVVCSNESFIVIVPFWATWPYETIIISKRHVKSILEFTEEEKLDLSKIIKILTHIYDNLFNCSFPYSAGMHQAPVNDEEYTEWHWHMHFYPPLLRNSEIKKFMVGYEMLASPQRDINPEFAASKLKELYNLFFQNN
jgi:UDPglucose--hexose-1-phosphate uridylyltransferase